MRMLIVNREQTNTIFVRGNDIRQQLPRQPFILLFFCTLLFLILPHPAWIWRKQQLLTSMCVTKNIYTVYIHITKSDPEIKQMGKFLPQTRRKTQIHQKWQVAKSTPGSPWLQSAAFALQVFDSTTVDSSFIMSLNTFTNKGMLVHRSGSKW